MHVCRCEYFFFRQKREYEIKECDWSSDVCSSDLESSPAGGAFPTRYAGYDLSAGNGKCPANGNGVRIARVSRGQGLNHVVRTGTQWLPSRTIPLCDSIKACFA